LLCDKCYAARLAADAAYAAQRAAQKAAQDKLNKQIILWTVAIGLVLFIVYHLP
jgi:hypothetical protein